MQKGGENFWPTWGGGGGRPWKKNQLIFWLNFSQHDFVWGWWRAMNLFRFQVGSKILQNFSFVSARSLLKVDMPILTCIFSTFNWLMLTSEMHFVKFHPEVASRLLSRGKRKYEPLGMRLIWKYIWNYFLVYQLISHFLSYLQNYKEFKAKILDLQPEKYGHSFDIKKCTTSGWALGDENVISIRAFNYNLWTVPDACIEYLTQPPCKIDIYSHTK